MQEPIIINKISISLMLEETPILAKISYKSITRIELLASGSFQELIQKIYQHFPLSSKTFYHLYYKEQQMVKSINSPHLFEEYACLNSKKPKLFLEATQDANLHFTAKPTEVKAYEQHNQELQQQLSKLREEMKEKLSVTKAKLIDRVKHQLTQKTTEKKNKTQHSDQTHQGFTCDACHANDFKGPRYQCAICNYNICQQCEKGKYKHPQNHPLIKIKEKNIRITSKNNVLLTQYQQKKQQTKPKIKAQTQFITLLMQILRLSEEQASKMINLHPKKDLNELIDLYLSKN